MNFLSIKDYMLPCLNKQLFGIDCPGCGIQRSLAHIIHGEFIEAFKMYPAIYTMIFLGGFILINLKMKFKYAQKIILTLAIINVLIIIVSYVIKMNSIIN
jgi:hypothetical protein